MYWIRDIEMVERSIFDYDFKRVSPLDQTCQKLYSNTTYAIIGY